MYDSKQIAAFAILRCGDNCRISNLQLQRMMYLIQRHYLCIGRTAFNEDFVAAKFGPMLLEVYYEYCGFGAMPIYLPEDYLKARANNIKEEDQNRIGDIVDTYKNVEFWDLVKDINRDDGAWAEIYNNGRGLYHIIPKQLIKEMP